MPTSIITDPRQHPPYRDLTDQRFGRLVAIGRTNQRSGRSVIWECICDCGQRKFIASSRLSRGLVRSCGCLAKELLIARITKHGRTLRNNKPERLWYVWAAMRKRCRNPKNKSYKNYGGRGIVVADVWKDYETFRTWAYENGYRDGAGLTLERTDNDGAYSPDNCIFASRLVQGGNTRRNRLLSAFGETKHLAEWVRDPRCKVHRTTLHKRLKQGMSMEAALQIEQQ